MTANSGPVSLETRGNIAVVTIDNPPVNATSQAVRAGLLDVITKADEDKDIAAIVINFVSKRIQANGRQQRCGVARINQAVAKND